MKRIFVFSLLVVLVCCSSTVALATTWYNATGEEAPPPQSHPWKDGYIIANYYDKGPIAIMYEQQEEANGRFELWGRYTVVSDVLGGFVGNGGGKHPLFYIYHLDVLLKTNGSPFFWGVNESHLVYLSTANVDGIYGINQVDYQFVKDKWWEDIDCRFNTDVDRNSITDRADGNIVAHLWRNKAEPDKTMKAMMAEISHIPFEEMSSAAVAAAPSRYPNDEVALFNLADKLRDMDIETSSRFSPQGKLTTSWGNIKK